MTQSDWPALRSRIEETERQMRIARFLFRVLRLDQVEPLPVGEYAVAFGYVELCNDYRAELDRLRESIGTPQSIASSIASSNVGESGSE